MGAVLTLGISGDPSGDNCNHQEAFRKEEKGPWKLIKKIFLNFFLLSFKTE